jgi:hypothetical protein
VRGIQLRPVVVAWASEVLKQSLEQETEFHNTAVARLNAELEKVQSRLKQAYHDKRDGKITDEFWADPRHGTRVVRRSRPKVRVGVRAVAPISRRTVSRGVTPNAGSRALIHGLNAREPAEIRRAQGTCSTREEERSEGKRNEEESHSRSQVRVVDDTARSNKSVLNPRPLKHA